MEKKLPKGVNVLIPWYQQKTTWTAVAGIIGALGAYFTGEVSFIVCLGSCLGALSIIFARQGIEKSTYIRTQEGRGEVVE